jgi:hypothetical protein
VPPTCPTKKELRGTASLALPTLQQPYLGFAGLLQSLHDNLLKKAI